MPTIQEYMAQFDAQIASGSGNTPAIDLRKTPVPAAAPKKTKDPSLLRRAGDFGVDVLKAVPTLVEAGAGLAGMVPGVHYAADPIGKVAGDVAEGLGNKLYSGKRLEEEASIAQRMTAAQDTGMLNQAKTAVDAYTDNPYALIGMVGQSLGLAKGGAVLGKKVLSAVGKPIKSADGVIDNARAATAGQVGEGLVAGGLVAANAAQENPDEFASRYYGLPAGALTTMISRGANKLMPDTADVDTLFAGGARPSAASGILGTAKNVGMMAFKEGVLEEALQSGQEQIFTNLSTNQPVLRGVGGAMASGAMAGSIMGGAFGFKQRKPAGEMTNDDLITSVDNELAPPPAPTDDPTMQAEWDAMQREFGVANAAPNQVPTPFADQAQTNQAAIDQITRADENDLARQQAEASVTTPFAEQARQNDEVIGATLAQDARDSVRDMPTPELERSLALVEQSIVAGQPMENAGNLMSMLRDELELRATEPQGENRTQQLFDTEWQRSPEVAQAAQAQAAPDMTADELSARLLAAQAPAPDGQAALMAGQLPAPSPIEAAQGGTPVAAVPASSLKGLPKAAQTELGRYATDPQQMAEAVADMFYTKAEAGSSAAYVFDKLPALYQQLTGQPLPETRAAATPLQRSATPFELQGETNEQAAANHARAQEVAAAATPLPNVDVSPKQAGFLTPDGEVDTVQPGLSRRESARQTAARKYAAQQQATRQADRKEIAGMLGENIPAPVVTNETPVGDTQAALPLTDATQTQEKKDDAAPVVAELGGKGSRGNAGAGAGTGSDRADSAPGRAGGSTGTPAASVAQPVVVGSGTGERTARVAPPQGASATAPGFSFKDMRDAYEGSRSGAAGLDARLVELTGIAEIEQIGGTKQQREQAKKYLDSVAVDPKEAATARRQAQDAVGRVAAQEKRQGERDKAVAARQKALDKQMKDMQDAEGGVGLSALEQKIRNARKKDKSADRERRFIPPVAAAAWDKLMAELDGMARKAGVKVTDVKGEGKASGTATAPANPNVHTPRSLAEALVEKFGEDMRDAILAGRVQIVADQTHLAAMTGDASRRGKITQGMYYYNPKAGPGTGTVYFIAANLARTQQGYTAFDVALHEIGEHAGMEQMLGKQNYQQLLGSIRKAMAVQTPKSQFERDVAAAKNKLLEDQQGQPHEVLAYMIQHTPDSTGLQKMWAAIKAFAARFGLLPDAMKDAATMRTLAAGATAKWLNKVAATSERDAIKRRGTIKRVEAERALMLRGLKQERMRAEATVEAIEKLLYTGKGNLVGAKMELASLTGAKRDYDTVLAQSKAELLAGVETKMLTMRETRLAEVKAKLAGIEQKIADINAKYDAQLPDAQPAVKGAASGIADPETRKIFTNFSDATAAAKKALSGVEALKAQDWLGKTNSAFTQGISWLTKHHLTALFDKSLNGGLALNVKADTIQEATSARLNQMFNEPYHQFEALERATPERAKMLGQLMQATEFQMDPRKGWEAHTHLHTLAGDQLSLAKKYLNEYRQMWGKLTPTETKLYNDLATMNEAMYTAELAVVTYNMVRANPGAQQLDVFKADPTEKFRQSKAVHDSIENAQTYWRGVLDAYVAAIDKHVADQRGVLPKRGETDPEYQAEVNRLLKGVQNEKVRNRVRAQLRTHSGKLSDGDRKIVRHLTPLEAQLRTVSDTVETFKHAPYFHLGRFGDDFVAFRVRNDGTAADPAAMAHVQRVLAEQFPSVTIRTDATDPHVFARFENVTEAHNFEKALFELQDQGWLMQEGAKDQGNKDLGKIVRGTRATVTENHAGPQWLEMVVESIQAEGYDAEIEAQMVAHVRSLYIDSLPDSAAIKVKLRREGRPGWHSDMLRNYAHRMRVGSNRVASLASEPTRTQSFSVMKDALAQAGEDRSVDRADIKKRHAVVEEFKKRHSDQMTVPKTPGVDMLRAVNHAYFLGMSPSYVLIQMTQLGVLTWPELAKKHGFVKSAKVIAEVSGTAFKIMTAVIAEGYKARGIKGSADMVITGEMLEKAGVSASDAEFLTAVMASGKLDIGNASRELGRVAEGAAEGKWGRRGTEALRVASAFGYASETLTRTITALAAKRLHKGPGAVEYAIGVIDESMLNYNSNNIGRMTGKQGVVGKPTQIMFSFLQYQFQLLEKLYREFYTAFAKGATPEQQAEARKFLGGHMMSMLALAGTLGLPFATAIAAAADKLCEMFGDGHCDSKIALRNATSDVFGHDLEPLLSRGLLSRALGTDISDRAGEANILPFSKFLADKRAMDERFTDLATASWGAPSAMIVSMFKGYEMIAQGDLLGGMQEAVPLALKGPLKAFTLSEKGYTDKAGNVLPMKAGAWDIFLQTMGLNPGEKADYQQAKFAQSVRSGSLGREGTQIRQKLASAIEQGDREATQKWSERAQAFDTTNPSHAILPRMASVLQQRARSRAQAEATSTTLGVSLKDIEAQQLTRFMQLQ